MPNQGADVRDGVYGVYRWGKCPGRCPVEQLINASAYRPLSTFKT